MANKHTSHGLHVFLAAGNKDDPTHFEKINGAGKYTQTHYTLTHPGTRPSQ